jgi:cytochrome c-type biogenesis protein CcmH/NrfF
MRVNPRFRSRVLLGLLIAASLGQSAVPLADPRVRRIGEMLTCQCGCNYTVGSCSMQNCHFADPAREKLLAMVGSGKSEREILASFQAEYGLKILQKPPAEGFYLLSWVMPWVGLTAGLALLYWAMQRLRKPRVAAGVAELPEDSPELRHLEQIKKETSDLE